MRFLKASFLILAISLNVTAAASDFTQKCLKYFQRFNSKKYPVDLAKLPKTLVFEDDAFLEIEEYLAHGRPSVVALLKDDGGGSVRRVAKIARAPKYRAELLAEFDFYERHKKMLVGHLIPILEKKNSVDRGPVLIKPFVEDFSLRSLVLKSELTQLQLDSVRKLNEWVEQFYLDTGVRIDMNPMNYVWVQNPAVLEQMNLPAPSFVFYEVTPRGAKIDTLIHKAFHRKLRAYGIPDGVKVEELSHK